MLTEDTLRDALRACFDPRYGLNIVDLGLVHRVELTPDPEAPGTGIAGVPARLRLRLELLEASDDPEYQAGLLALVGNRLGGMPELSRQTVTVVGTPPWTAERISAEGRKQLKLDQPQFLILNNRTSGAGPGSG